MKILSIKPVENQFSVECHSTEDFGFVASLIQRGDFVSGETDRNIKPREPGQKPFRIKMHITVDAQVVEVDETTPALRVSGLIEAGSPIEFVEMHAQHALVFNAFQPIRVQKEQLFQHDIIRLREREKESQKPLYLGVVLDDEEALILQVSGSGLKELGKINALKSGKQFKNESKTNAYFEKLAEIIFASPLQTIILAGPGFTREELFKYVRENTPKGKEKTWLSVATADTGQKGIREALSNASISKALGESKISQESELMHEVLKQLGKDSGLVAYGLTHVQRAVSAGAAHTLLISSSFVSENRDACNALLDLAGRMGIVSHILDEKFEPGQQLAGLSGVVALLRYRFE
jgi:protein pelota